MAELTRNSDDGLRRVAKLLEGRIDRVAEQANLSASRGNDAELSGKLDDLSARMAKLQEQLDQQASRLNALETDPPSDLDAISL